MTVYVKPAVRHAWAELATGSDIQDPGDSYAAAGYLLGVKPPRQFDNWLYNFAFNGLRYFCQVGIVDYDAAETYPLGGIVRGPDGIIYRSLAANNVAHTPASSPTQWGAPQFFTPGSADNSNSVATTAWVRGYALAIGTSIGSLSGTVTNGQIPVGAVTQWQGALTLSFSQIPGQLFLSQIPQAGVTQWQTALSIAWGQITGTKNADELGGLALGPNNGFAANTVARYDSVNGYLFAEFFNQASPNNENPTISQAMVTNGTDNFLRKASMGALGNALFIQKLFNQGGGYVQIGGLYIEWGFVHIGDIIGSTFGSVTFPLAFPTGPMGLVATPYEATFANISSSGADFVVNTNGLSSTGFNWGVRELLGNVEDAWVMWIALGH